MCQEKKFVAPRKLERTTYSYWQVMAGSLCLVIWVHKRAFLQFRGSRAGLFSDLSAGESCPLPIVPQAGPAVSPTDKPRKDGALRLGRARRGPPVTSEKPSYQPSTVTSYSY